MLDHIERLRKDILLYWVQEVKKHIKEGMEFTLLAKDEKGDLSVNFNLNLKNALKDTKYILLMELAVPEDIKQFYEKEERLWVRTQRKEKKVLINDF